MKKLLLLIGFSLILSACATAPVCDIHEDAELNKMTVDELKSLVLKNSETIKGASLATDAERANRDSCLSQNERIEKIIKSKSPKVPVSRYYIFH